MIDTDAFNAFEAAGWETRALDYDEHWSDLTLRLADPLLDAVGVGPQVRVLDVASGPGHVAGRAAERGALTTGVDVAAAMVELARHRHPRVTFQQADAQSLPFPDKTFDAVVGNLAVPHFGRPEQAVAEFGRVLRPDGWLGLTTWDLPERARPLGVLLEAVKDTGMARLDTVPEGPDFFRYADDEEFRALLNERGFTDTVVSSMTFTRSVRNPDELWDGLLRGTLRTSAVVLDQPEDVLMKIRSGFDERMEGYRATHSYDLPVSFKLAAGRRAEGRGTPR